jgi:hypothetical protein
MVAFRICRSRVHALIQAIQNEGTGGEGARKIPERLRKGIGVGVIRIKK